MTDDTPHYLIPDTPLQRQMAIGHLRRTDHELTGYLVPTDDNGIMRLVRTCCEEK